MTKHLRLICPLVLSMFVAACSGGGSSPTSPTPTPTPTPAPTPTLTGLTLSGGSCTSFGACTVAGSQQLVITAQLSNGTTQVVTSSATYTTSNAAAATVSSGGLVTARGQSSGTADVGANYQGRSVAVTVNVPAPWSAASTGNTVFDAPTYLSRVRVIGDYTGNSSNFVIYINGRLLVNELLGTAWGATRYDGTALTSGGVGEVKLSTGVRWSVTEVRP